MMMMMLVVVVVMVMVMISLLLLWLSPCDVTKKVAFHGQTLLEQFAVPPDQSPPRSVPGT
jgi:heme/copper-type cytochrome/quinol oxidase subunit 2